MIVIVEGGIIVLVEFLAIPILIGTVTGRKVISVNRQQIKERKSDRK